MRSLSSILYFTLCLSLSSCSTSKKEQPETAPTASISSTMPDTIPTPPKPLAPGTAQVTASVMEFQEATGGVRCSLKIATVHGYGSATPPLPPDTIIDVLISNSLLERVDTSKSTDTLLATDNTFKLTLKHTAMAGMLGNNSTSWQAVSMATVAE